MEIKTITIKKNLNQNNLRQNINKFFNQTKFNSQYVYFLIKVTAEGGKSSYNLSNKMLINLKQKDQVRAYINSVERTFLKNENKFKSSAKDKILVYFIESNKEDYIKYVSNLAQTKNFDLD